MDGSSRLSADERKALVQEYRSGPPHRGRRTHILLLLDDGLTVREVRQVTCASFDLINDCRRRYCTVGVVAVVETATVDESVPQWLIHVTQWLPHRTPADFG